MTLGRKFLQILRRFLLFLMMTQYRYQEYSDQLCKYGLVFRLHAMFFFLLNSYEVLIGSVLSMSKRDNTSGDF
ncbi:hypothetical protein QQP08_005887 [Theobroma cacao]|nr:hypothetical protein QQP08_005887 [Theobroma cacao]